MRLNEGGGVGWWGICGLCMAVRRTAKLKLAVRLAAEDGDFPTLQLFFARSNEVRIYLHTNSWVQPIPLYHI